MVLLFNENIFLGNIPESVELLVFGVVLIGIAVGLRWILNLENKSVKVRDQVEVVVRDQNIERERLPEGLVFEKD